MTSPTTTSSRRSKYSASLAYEARCQYQVNNQTIIRLHSSLTRCLSEHLRAHLSASLKPPRPPSHAYIQVRPLISHTLLFNQLKQPLGVTEPRTLTTTATNRVEGDLANPQSTSSEQSSVKISRATKDQKSQDTASLAQPVSDRSAIPGEKDETTPTEEEMKRDPKEPAESKRAHVEKQGEKPLGPEDHQ